MRLLLVCLMLTLSTYAHSSDDAVNDFFRRANILNPSTNETYTFQILESARHDAGVNYLKVYYERGRWIYFFETPGTSDVVLNLPLRNFKSENYTSIVKLSEKEYADIVRSAKEARVIEARAQHRLREADEIRRAEIQSAQRRASQRELDAAQIAMESPNQQEVYRKLKGLKKGDVFEYQSRSTGEVRRITVIHALTDDLGNVRAIDGTDLNSLDSFGNPERYTLGTNGIDPSTITRVSTAAENEGVGAFARIRNFFRRGNAAELAREHSSQSAGSRAATRLLEDLNSIRFTNLMSEIDRLQLKIDGYKARIPELNVNDVMQLSRDADELKALKLELNQFIKGSDLGDLQLVLKNEPALLAKLSTALDARNADEIERLLKGHLADDVVDVLVKGEKSGLGQKLLRGIVRGAPLLGVVMTGVMIKDIREEGSNESNDSFDPARAGRAMGR